MISILACFVSARQSSKMCTDGRLTENKLANLEFCSIWSKRIPLGVSVWSPWTPSVLT